MMGKSVILMAALLSTLLAPLSWADDALMAKGRAIAEQVCVACHNLNGVSSSDAFPHLAGQYQDYMVKTLRDYRSGKRANALMNGFAAALSLEDIDAVSAWYANQPSVLHVLQLDATNPD